MAGDVNKGGGLRGGAGQSVADRVQYANEVWPVALSSPQGCYIRLLCSFTYRNCVNMSDRIFSFFCLIVHLCLGMYLV